MKVAFIFPGQGSQQVGMGKAVYEAIPAAKETYQEADAALQWAVSDLSFNGPEEKLNQTEYTQPAILTASIALWRSLPPEVCALTDAVAGHSLGEYSALVAAGSLAFRDAVVLVQRRGLFMQEAVPQGQGKMAAILGLSRAEITRLCRQASAEGAGVVGPANFNAPDQVVISGEVNAVDRAMQLSKEAGAKRIIPLPVSVPSHCSLMAPACRRLALELERIDFQDLEFPLLNNLEAREIANGQEAKEGLVAQLSSPLLWEESISALWARGVSHFIEIGPGRVLSGLVKRIRREAQVYNIEGPRELETVAGILTG